MSEQELEIARSMGATSFLVYNIIKKFPNSTTSEIVMHSALNTTTVRAVLGKLENAKIVNTEIVSRNRAMGFYKFTLKQPTEWLIKEPIH